MFTGRVLIAFDDADGHHEIDSKVSIPDDTPTQRAGIERLCQQGVITDAEPELAPDEPRTKTRSKR